MPMDRKRYPANWDEIARRVKDEADWKCEVCGRQCRRPGEPHCGASGPHAGELREGQPQGHVPGVPFAL